ncbi:MAG TPA: hypothetical protein VHC49_06345 [Mycobacteriales bacterium]|nr:hypothetical protein [Mycobacteriales bacterium]
MLKNVLAGLAVLLAMVVAPATAHAQSPAPGLDVSRTNVTSDSITPKMIENKCDTGIGHTSGNTYDIYFYNWGQDRTYLHVYKNQTLVYSSSFVTNDTFRLGVNYGTSVIMSLSTTGACDGREIYWQGQGTIGDVPYTQILD